VFDVVGADAQVDERFGERSTKVVSRYGSEWVRW